MLFGDLQRRVRQTSRGQDTAVPYLGTCLNRTLEK